MRVTEDPVQQAEQCVPQHLPLGLGRRRGPAGDPFWPVLPAPQRPIRREGELLDASGRAAP
jgi:hypothetical protein